MYWCSPLVMFTTGLLAASPGWAFEAQGSSAVPEPGAVKRAADNIAANMVVFSSARWASSAAHRDPFSGRRTASTHMGVTLNFQPAKGKGKKQSRTATQDHLVFF